MSEMLFSLPHITDVDAPLVEELIAAHCRLVLLRIYYSVAGEFSIERAKGKAGPQIVTHPVRKYETILRNQVIRLSETLGLSPDARRRMKVSAIQTMDLATRIQKLKEAEADVD